MGLRAPHEDEAGAVYELLAARDTKDLGKPDITLGDVRDEWSAPGFELRRDAVVWDWGHGELGGYALVRKAGTLGAVHPRSERRGIGRALLDWTERRQRELGWTAHQTAIVAGNARAVALLRGAGYAVLRSYWRMVKPLASSDERAEPPDGIAFRVVRPAHDARAIYELDRRAFATVAGTEEESLEAFTEQHLKGHDFDSAISRVAEQDGRIVGFALVRDWRDEGAGFVDVLAVDPAVHGRGIGRALLTGAFAEMRAAGLAEGQLGVAGDNGKALRLYEGVGMRPRFQLDVYARPVDGL